MSFWDMAGRRPGVPDEAEGLVWTTPRGESTWPVQGAERVMTG